MAINLRKEAKGRECQIRASGICNRDRETVVLAHLNSKGLLGVGMGQKVPDIFGAWACSACHDFVDGRVNSKGLTALQIYVLHLEGVLRTQKILLDEGKI